MVIIIFAFTGDWCLVTGLLGWCFTARLWWTPSLLRFLDDRRMFSWRGLSVCVVLQPFFALPSDGRCDMRKLFSICYIFLVFCCCFFSFFFFLFGPKFYVCGLSQLRLPSELTLAISHSHHSRFCFGWYLSPFFLRCLICSFWLLSALFWDDRHCWMLIVVISQKSHHTCRAEHLHIVHKVLTRVPHLRYLFRTRLFASKKFFSIKTFPRGGVVWHSSN